MKKIFKIVLVFSVFLTFYFFVSYSKVYASSNSLNKEDTLSILNSSIDIYNGKYDEYTDDDKSADWKDHRNENIYDYMNEANEYCGFYMDYKSKPTWGGLKKGVATIHGDDPIIYFVPRELFIHRGQHTYVGKEYGFFVNTTAFSSNGELETANSVDVFIFDIITSGDNFYFEYKIRPLYVFSYIYLSEYIFFENSEVIINDMKISLDEDAYSSYSDAIIPIPAVKDEQVINIYGENYPQDYAEAQPNKDKYAIKDTKTFVALYNVNNLNSFDNQYDINNDKGYIITRSYATYNGYSIYNPNVNYSNILANDIDLIAGIVGIINSDFGKAYTIVDTIFTIFNDVASCYNGSIIGYELSNLDNNPTEVYKGGKISQKQWYLEKGFEEQYWKLDTKSISSSPNNALIFKSVSYDIDDYPIYNDITYHWDLESESLEEAYFVYGTEIQIAIKNEENDSFDEIDVGKSFYYNIIGNDLSKQITIYNEQTGYMLKEGKYDDFAFIPEYSGYYSFFAPSYAKIFLYKGDTLLKIEDSNIDYIFEKNIEYKFVVEINNFPQTSRLYHVSIRPYTVTTTCDLLLNEYINEFSDEGLIKLYCNETNLFNIELYYILDSIKNSLNFEVYDDNMNIIQKYSFNDFDNTANLTESSINSINVELQNGRYYYIKFSIISLYDIHLKISNIENNLDMEENYELISDIGDNFSLISIPYNSNYSISFGYYNYPIKNNNMIIVLLRFRNDEFELLNSIKCNGREGNNTSTYALEKQDVLYFGYFNGETNISVNFYCFESPNYEFTITTETEYATDLTGLGTEITVNSGERYDNKIAAGFTRVLYLGEDAAYNSRYSDYTWSSTDPSIATVSAYGTVFAKKEGKTIIRVTDKHNQNHVALLEIIVYKKETSTAIILSTDLNADESLNGTEVRLNGGVQGNNTIHVGYTRSICIIENGPTNIRQDYNWVSSDSSIASVDKYGIVHANSEGIVEIRCINKYDEKCIGIIVIQII